MTGSQSAQGSGTCPSLAALRSKRREILRIAASHGASNVRLFGSVARQTSGPDSDVDMLVDIEPGRTMVDYVRLWGDLEELLGTRADVVSAAALTDRDEDIRADAVPL